VRRFFDRAQETLGVVTVLVNNAGVGGSDVCLKDLSDDAWDQVVKTNLYGPFYACREFIQRLNGTGKAGSIINITSVHQEVPRVGAADYAASKGGLRNLTKTLALEVADKGITVNNIAPGMILTPMNQEAIDDPAIRAQRVKNIPVNRPGEPWEVARAAVFLASKDARYIHGSTLTIDGGLELAQGQGA
jgi:glucose 1-dehydrogenase